MMKKGASLIALASIWWLSASFLPANAQQHAPVLLIHGYGENSHVWDSWINWLRNDHFNMTEVKAITFSNDDECGTVKQHANELGNQVSSLLSATHSDKVNIVAHSKGGLEARWYIAHSNVDKVANLVMLGTPNSGTAAAYLDLTSCAFDGSAGLEDLTPDSEATQAVDQTHSTHYYTIAGDYAIPCLFVGGFTFICYLIANDGWVTVSSAQSSPDISYPSLGVFPYDHAGLVTHKDVYDKVLSVLTENTR